VRQKPRKTALAELIRFENDSDDVRKARQHPRWETEDEYGPVVHLDLVWYEQADIKTHKRARSAFRDAFFKALCERKSIVLHCALHCERSQREYRHVYPKDF